jgi:pimeloyl-ACP methyl ester carboxylesterase
MGGYYAPRAAAFEKRFAAGVAWGAHFDYHANWVKRRKVLESGGTKVLGTALSVAMGDGHTRHGQRDEESREVHRFAGVAEKIECPFLITQGELDSLSPLETGRLLYDTIGSKVKKLKVFSKEDGGAEHCQGDNRQFGSNYVADWLADILKATPPQQFNPHT